MNLLMMSRRWGGDAFSLFVGKGGNKGLGHDSTTRNPTLGRGKSRTSLKGRTRRDQKRGQESKTRAFRGGGPHRKDEGTRGDLQTVKGPGFLAGGPPKNPKREKKKKLRGN